MAIRWAWPAVIGAASIWVGVAVAAQAANPIPGTFSGDYKVTITVTNTHSKPTHWLYEAHPTCASLCRAISFRERLASAKSWPKGVVTYHWNGKIYIVSKTFRKHADCSPKSGGTVKKGYDVFAKYGLFVRRVTNGRVVQWNVIGKDRYVPNAAGRAKHCTAGAYDYAFNGVAQ